MNLDEKYMQRCLELAANGLGQTYPNPMVGCVIVLKDKIIGEGWHQKAGKAHAEVNAINNVTDQYQLKKSTLYVNLEPCSHYGKTPPCSDLIIKKKIPKVVIGSVDPNPKVAGKGIVKLQKAGVDVKVGCLEEASDLLNKRFFTFQSKKRPYIILKWAETQDGFIAPLEQEKGKPVWITNPYSKQLVHKWRSEEQAILIGRETALKDNPQLNTRLWKGQSPIRILIDRHLKSYTDTPELHLFDQSVKTIVFCEKEAPHQENLNFEKIDFSKAVVPQVLTCLYRYNIQSLIVEGGQKTLQHFIDTNLWDEARVFVGELRFKKGVLAPKYKAKQNFKKQVKTDQLKLYSNIN